MINTSWKAGFYDNLKLHIEQKVKIRGSGYAECSIASD